MRRIALALVLAVIASVAAACQVRLPGAPGCPIFPDDSIWHADVSKLPVDPRSGSYIAAIGESAPLKADFGSGLWDGGPIGIPYAIVGAATAQGRRQLRLRRRERPRALPDPGERADRRRRAAATATATCWSSTSDTCTLYELFAAYPQADGSWHAGSGAVWNLNVERPAPGRVDLGRRRRAARSCPGSSAMTRSRPARSTHAIRFTVPRTQRAAVWPARHQAGSRTDPSLPPMGLRLRLKPSVDISASAGQYASS